MFKNTTLLDDFKHTLSCFSIWESFRIPKSKKQRFVSRILIYKNENARNEKNGGSAFLLYSSEKGFFLHNRGLPLPPLAFPRVPVSRSVSRCPSVPVRVPSLPLPFVASPEMLKNQRCFDDLKPKRLKIRRVSQLLNTNV